jgi:hypothetical protein
MAAPPTPAPAPWRQDSRRPSATSIGLHPVLPETTSTRALTGTSIAEPREGTGSRSVLARSVLRTANGFSRSSENTARERRETSDRAPRGRPARRRAAPLLGPRLCGLRLRALTAEGLAPLRDQASAASVSVSGRASPSASPSVGGEPVAPTNSLAPHRAPRNAKPLDGILKHDVRELILPQAGDELGT